MHRRDTRWSRPDPAKGSLQRAVQPAKSGASIAVDFYRNYLKEVVTIHQAMFEKLLFEEHAAVDMDLAELFQDVGKTYLRISERISENCSSHSLQD
jgi:hypothetical protein